MQLTRLRRVKLPKAGKLGILFVSFLSSTLGAERGLFPVTLKPQSSDRANRLEKGARAKPRKIELRSAEVPLEDIMASVANFFGPQRRIIGAQLDLDGRRESWINRALLEDENFKGLARSLEMLNNGCNEKQNVFFRKLSMLYALDLGLPRKEPERLFAEIEFFKKGFDVWL